MIYPIILILFFLFIMMLTVQALYNIQTSLYGWFDPKVIAQREATTAAYYLRTMTVLVPAYKEELVIAQTIKKLSEAQYPPSYIQILILCREGDDPTIKAARLSLSENNIYNARVLIYKGDVPGKPPQLNHGLKEATGQLTVIVDAEDDVDPQLFAIANQQFEQNDIDVLQMGVQLMDYDTRWYSVHNVLEYYFQFRSRMYYQAEKGVVPLGGNTCFFKTVDLLDQNGWDETCLTEDAEIGLRLSSIGKKFGVYYSASHVTREETPENLRAFIKQRTRWNQGFLQTIDRGFWKSLPTRKQRILAFYVLIMPFFQAVVFLLTPLFIWLAFNSKMPLLLSLTSFIPLALLVFLLGIQMVGLREFGKEQHIKINPIAYAVLAITFLPFQYALSYAALRAGKRYLSNNEAWEKTAHSGAHRQELKEAYSS